MFVDDCFHVRHTTVAYFDIVFVKYLVKFVLLRKVSLHEVEEESSDVGGDVTIVRRVEPDNVSFAVSCYLVS